jgi:hypothetical protein
MENSRTKWWSVLCDFLASTPDGTIPCLFLLQKSKVLGFSFVWAKRAFGSELKLQFHWNLNSVYAKGKMAAQ